jgi:hypothetical protein
VNRAVEAASAALEGPWGSMTPTPARQAFGAACRSLGGPFRRDWAD